MTEKQPKRIAVAVIERTCHESSATQVLIGRRPEGGPLAGYWEFPGGKAHQDESFEVAAVRECGEETGLSVEVGEEISEVFFQYDHASVHLRFFRCTLLTDTSPSDPFCWVAKSELAKFRFPAANDKLVRRLVTEAMA